MLVGKPLAGAVLMFLTCLLALPDVAAAQGGPAPPHIFHGFVTVDGAPPPDDTPVQAFIAGEIKGSGLVKDGHYLLAVGQGDGEAIVFTVGGVPAPETGRWEFGGATVLDLTARAGSRTLLNVMSDLILRGKLDRVFWFDNATKTWRWYFGNPALNDLNTLDSLPTGAPAWVKVTGPVTAFIGGQPYPFTCSGGNCWHLITVP